MAQAPAHRSAADKSYLNLKNRALNLWHSGVSEPSVQRKTIWFITLIKAPIQMERANLFSAFARIENAAIYQPEVYVKKVY